MIDYKLLYKAVKYFGKNGFIQVEVPWRVSKEAIILDKYTLKMYIK